MTNTVESLQSKMNGAIYACEKLVDDFYPVDEKIRDYANELLTKLPANLLNALDSDDGSIYPSPRGTLFFDWEDDFGSQILIEIGMTSSSCHAWINKEDIRSVENSPHGDLSWLDFMQESFQQMKLKP